MTGEPDTTEFAGRVALVTASAGTGIGQATARRLAAGAATVIVTDIHERRTHAVVDRSPRTSRRPLWPDFPWMQATGARSMRSCPRWSNDSVQLEFWSITRAVNVIGSIFDYDPEVWDQTLRVNLSGPWYLCRQVMPLMRSAGGGVIVNIRTYAPDIGGSGIEPPTPSRRAGSTC